MAAVLGLIIGVVIGVFVRPDIPIELQPYLPIMVLAALDAFPAADRSDRSARHTNLYQCVLHSTLHL